MSRLTLKDLFPGLDVHPRSWFRRDSLGDDLKAGLVLGIQSVPSGMSTGVLAGLSPMAGVYAGLFGTLGGAIFASSVLMPVQATGALAIIVKDAGLSSMSDPARALATLTVLTGLFMVIAGALHLGRWVRFVSKSVMTGFIAAVGVNIILSQVPDITGYKADAGDRVIRTILTLWHIMDWKWQPLLVGLVTAASVWLLRRTRLGGLSYVVAIVLSWAMAAWLNGQGAKLVLASSLGKIPQGPPPPILPSLADALPLVLPALSLAFVGLVQGAGVSGNVKNPDGSKSDSSQDFVAEGAGNLLSGVFRGMPVGGSASATVLLTSVGGRSRGALFVTAIVMMVIVIALGQFIGQVPLAGLAGILLVVGFDTVPVPKIKRISQTGRTPSIVMVVTFIMTVIMPLQYSVLVGVGMSLVLFAVGESRRLELRELVLESDGRLRETQPPPFLAERQVVMIQPYGTMFFASAEPLIEKLPQPIEQTNHSVVILRMRGDQAPSATLVDRLNAYGSELARKNSRFIVVTTNEELIKELKKDIVVEESEARLIYQGNEYLGETLRKAYDDSLKWVLES